jgi:trk system potassium uptake protein TrkH
MKCFLQQKINIKAILGNIGLLLHVPIFMYLLTLFISLIFKEYFAILPIFLVLIFNLIIAQFLYKFFFENIKINLWDIIISIAVSWFLAPLFGSFIFYFVSHFSNIDSLSILSLKSFINSLFESFSGFTSTGLSMVKFPSTLPKSLQFFRSIEQWVGGVGLIIFVLSLIEPKEEDYELFLMEAKTYSFAKNIINTTRVIVLIYIIYTILSFLFFVFFKMPVWEAVNHSMSTIATGGFTITDDSFSSYNKSIKITAMIIMVFGSISFSIHYKMLFKKKFFEFFKNIQSRVFIIILIIGSGLIALLNLNKITVLNSFFQFFSSLATSGFYSDKISLYQSSTKLLLIFAMFVGGCSGSTVGGIKIRRLIFLFESIILRVKSFTLQTEKKILIRKNIKMEPSAININGSEKTNRLYEASVLFFLWTLTLFIGSLLVLFCEKDLLLVNVLFDVISALSNVGLSTGVIDESICFFSKVVFIFVMWLGRVEIIPVIILFLSFFCKKSKKKI